MKNIKEKTVNNKISLLDCTLRDGARIINCKLSDEDIKDITSRLMHANIDYIEVGFLRDPQKVNYEKNSTFFTDVEQITPFIPKDRKNSSFVAFIDYSLFNFTTLKKYDGKSIDGIRLGFTKNDYLNNYEDLVNACHIVKEKGYKLFVQGVNSLAYTDSEFLKVIEMVNLIKPYSFAIVDTYGAMYEEDFSHLYRLTNKNLDQDIRIAFHSHNNYQLSFALAQKFIKLAAESQREIIIDATLAGMGKCAGNLNLELIASYLVRKLNFNYKIDNLMDIIDDHTYNIRKNYNWGYSIPAVLSAIYQSHPNNVIYLTEKFRLATKDIKYILSMIPPETRTRYDYDLIKQLYITYNHTKVDDSDTLEKIKLLIQNRDILILVPGMSLLKYRQKLNEYIKLNNPIVIPVNFVSSLLDLRNQIPFFGSEKRYKKNAYNSNCKNKITVSNILEHSSDDLVVNYEGLIDRNNDNFDSSIIMLLNLLKKIEIESFTIAGFDGFDKGTSNYFDNEKFEDGRFDKEYETLTNNTKKMLKNYAKSLKKPLNIKFLTPSIYEEYFK